MLSTSLKVSHGRACDADRGEDDRGHQGTDSAGCIGKGSNSNGSCRAVSYEPTNGAILARPVPGRRSGRTERSFSCNAELPPSNRRGGRGCDRGGTTAVGLGIEEVAPAVERDVSGSRVSGSVNGRRDSVAPRVGCHAEGEAPNRTASGGGAVWGERAERADHHRLQGAVSTSRRALLLSTNSDGLGEPVFACVRGSVVDRFCSRVASDRASFPRAWAAEGHAKRQRTTVRDSQRPIVEHECEVDVGGCAAGIQPARQAAGQRPSRANASRSEGRCPSPSWIDAPRAKEVL